MSAKYVTRELIAKLTALSARRGIRILPALVRRRKPLARIALGVAARGVVAVVDVGEVVHVPQRKARLDLKMTEDVRRVVAVRR